MRKESLISGNPFKTLLLFSLPMILSVTLQQFYNICDSLIAGRMISNNALAAVSATYPIIMIYLAIATGFGVGVNIITARFIGEKNDIKSKESGFTAITFVLIAGIIIGLIGFLCTDLILKAINIDAVYFKDASIYLKYYAIGMPFLLLYNTSNSLFQSTGNSKIPLFLLFFSTILNLVLDIFLIKSFHMGLNGIALATFISQALASSISTIILIIYFNRQFNCKCIIFNKELLFKILAIAIPSIIQASIISIGQVFVQALINTYDPASVAGYGAAYKVSYVIVNIYTVMSNAISTYTSQNAGASEFERIKKGFHSGLMICGLLTVITTITFLLIPSKLLMIFMSENDDKVIEVGKMFIYSVAPFFFLLCIKIPCDGVLKGSKDMRSFMISTFTDLVLRVVLSYILSSKLGIIGIFISWPIGWLFGMCLSLLFYYLGRWKRLIGYEEYKI